MPFDFLRRRGTSDKARGGQHGLHGETRPRGVGFDGLTEEWRIVGHIDAEGRLSDVLNRREPMAIRSVSWAPIDGLANLSPAPGIQAIDPYDLIIVLAGEDSLPPLTDEERAAHRVHKVSYDVALELPPFRVIGTVLLFPGSEPDSLLQRASDMFIPVVDATAMAGSGDLVSAPGVEVMLVNRFYLRGVEQVDKATGERAQRLPGAPLGGVSWQDRSR